MNIGLAIGIGGLSVAAASGGGASTAYVTGDRSASITITTSSILLAVAADRLVNGSFTQSTVGSTYFRSSVSSVGVWILFDFGTAKVIDEAKWYQSGAASSGVWKWQRSSDASSWTDVGSSFTLGSSATQTMTELNGNTTAARYWRMLGVSGALNPGPWLEEIEFKQN